MEGNYRYFSLHTLKREFSDYEGGSNTHI